MVSALPCLLQRQCYLVSCTGMWEMFCLVLVCIDQVWYSLLCCNFIKESLMSRRGNREKSVRQNTGNGMRRIRVSCLKLNLRWKKNVESAWKWIPKLSCLAAAIPYASSATETGKNRLKFVNRVTIINHFPMPRSWLFSGLISLWHYLFCYDRRSRSQSCPFCRDSLKRVNSRELWIYTSNSDIVELSAIARENIKRLFMHVDKLPLIVADRMVVSYDTHFRWT